MSTKQFSIAAVVSMIDGKMIAPFDEIHELVEWLAGEPVWTHQIPRVSQEAIPALLEQFPGIADVHVPEGTDTWEKVEAFVATIAPRFGAWVQVTPMRPTDHTPIDPISELRMNRPGLEIIAVNTQDNE